jgi:hypothetical protein
VAEDRGEGDVRIVRMDDHLPDLSVMLPDVRPGLAGIRGFVDAVAGRHVATDVGFARAHVDDAGVRRSNRDRSNRRDRLVVEDRFHDAPPSTDFQTPPDAVAA